MSVIYNQFSPGVKTSKQKQQNRMTRRFYCININPLETHFYKMTYDLFVNIHNMVSIRKMTKLLSPNYDKITF